MEQRKPGEDHGPLVEERVRGDAPGVDDFVAVGVRGELGSAGRAAGVEQGGEVVGVGFGAGPFVRAGRHGGVEVVDGGSAQGFQGGSGACGSGGPECVEGDGLEFGCHGQRCAPGPGVEFGSGGNQDPGAAQAQEPGDVVGREVRVDRCGDRGGLGRQQCGGQECGVRGEQAHRFTAADAVGPEEMDEAVHLSTQFGEGAGVAVFPVLRAGQEGDGRPVGPQRGGPVQDGVGRGGQVPCGQRHFFDRGQGVGGGVVGPQGGSGRGRHHRASAVAARTGVCWVPRSREPSGVLMEAVTMSPGLR